MKECCNQRRGRVFGNMVSAEEVELASMEPCGSLLNRRWCLAVSRTLALEPELPRLRVDRLIGVNGKDAAAVAELELLVAVDADAEEAGEGVHGNAAERGTAH